MAITWIIFLSVLVFCTYSGYRRGIYSVLSRLLGLVLSYVVAVMYYDEAAAWLQRHTMVQGMLAYVLGSIALFAVTNFLFSAACTLLQKFVFRNRPRSWFSAAGGATLGLVLGVFWGLLGVFTVSYTSSLLQQVRGPVSNPANTNKTVAERNTIERWAHNFAAVLLEKVTSATDVAPTLSKLGSALVREPQQVTQKLQRVSRNPELKTLLNSPQNREILKGGDTAAIARLPEFQQLVGDPDFRDLMATAGVDVHDSSQYEQQVASQVSDVWQRLDAVKNDPRAEAILSDPDFRQRLQDNNPAALLTDDRFMQLVEILFSGDSENYSGAADSPDVALEGDEKGVNREPPKPGKVYSWTDENGRKHYSDQPPDRQQ